MTEKLFIIGNGMARNAPDYLRVILVHCTKFMRPAHPIDQCLTASPLAPLGASGAYRIDFT
ncbi:MAG: hypothetical protein EOS36_16330 [Mesorhizobium sp.]|uniref:hypothetical protein n=1 Tax=Mesorhizobium sp. TaxID=1871066 RepID=UPI000FE7FCF3|nr:hypothetical protein [Mesorhizobium sp.]RWD62003.1 MAG: hypothetical protein EOS36_16330 [Mesorhizobium sp.]RWE51181.1 MAG: hypothetical protein EOS79_01720 [Mesorhizobium sp.]